MPQYTEFFIESLERRKMMAGDVSISVSGGDLRIDGDDASNEFVISEGSNPGEIRVVGGNGTTINGQSELTFRGVDDGIRINLRDGNDRVGISGISVADDLRIQTGDGDDLVALVDLTVEDDVDIRTGSGDDQVVVFNSEIHDRLNIRTDSGNDEILLAVSTFDRASVNSGSDADKVGIFVNTFDDRISVNLGSGNDMIYEEQSTGDVRLNGGSGFDAFNVASIGGRSFEANDVDTLSAAISTQADVGVVSFQLNIDRS